MRSICVIILLVSMLISSASLTAQPGIGIGISTPDHRLHVKSTSAALLKLENSATLNTDVRTDLYFKTGGYHTGAIKTIGTGAAFSRLGLFTYTSVDPNELEERVSITDEGFVGIDNILPHAPLSFNDFAGSKIDFLYDQSNSRHGIGIQFGLLQMYCHHISSSIAFGTGSSASFTELMRIKGNGKVGIGTTSPAYLLDLKQAGADLFRLENSTTLANNVATSQFFKTGTMFTGAIKTIGTGTNVARFGLFTYASDDPAGLFERLSILDNGNVGIGTITPAYTLDVNGRMRIKHNGSSSGLWFANSTNTDDVAFVGLANNTHVGLYGDTGAGWNLVMNTTNGHVGIGILTPTVTLDVVGTGTALYAGRFVHNSSTDGVSGVLGKSINNETGIGVFGEGYQVGVKATANGVGSGFRFGVYSNASGGETNLAGYFNGNVYASGSFIPSDRKLKNEILPLICALSVINQLKPAMYEYKTEVYTHMQLPEGMRYGLVADEVKQVLPGVVKEVMQPAVYENQETQDGRILSNAVEFEAINYTEIIPILIAAIQEQQIQIEALKQQNEDLQSPHLPSMRELQQQIADLQVALEELRSESKNH